jgi:proteasome alpha subunit
MKAAFEQVYGAPFLTRMLFAEIGERPEEDLFVRVEYDGEIATNGATYGQTRQDFATLSGTQQSRELMEKFLATQHTPEADFETTFNSALDAWSIGHMTLQTGDAKEQPGRTAVAKHRKEQLAIAGIEAALLERDAGRAIRYRLLSDKELRALLRD